ncbi:MAG: hypothetical protein AB1445_13815, partial [Bacillota bacterium]
MRLQGRRLAAQGSLGTGDGGQERSLLSHASVSRLSERLWEEYEAFSERDLSGFDVVYLFA